MMNGFAKFLTIVILSSGGYFGYQRFFAARSEAFQAYEKFATALAEEDYDLAQEYSDGAAHNNVQLRHQRRLTPVLKMGKHSVNPPSKASIIGEVTWIKYNLKSEKSSAENKVQIEAVQTVCRIPPGVASAICKWTVSFKQSALMVFDEGDWWVSRFDSQKVK